MTTWQFNTTVCQLWEDELDWAEMTRHLENDCSLGITVYRNGLDFDRRTTSADKMSRLMGKPTICIGENKGADQLRGNREADQRLCFRYSDSAIPLLLKSEISSF